MAIAPTSSRTPRSAPGSRSAASRASTSRTTSTAAAALACALDLDISAPTAAAACAASVGTEVWFLTAGRTWPQLGTDEYPWYRKSTVFSPSTFGAWEEVIPKAGEALAALARDRSR